MPPQKPLWKKGRGKLGILNPILGSWVAQTDSPMGKLTCTRTFEPILSNAYIQLTANWVFEKFTYQEIAIFGVREGVLSFWSFTNDGKNSQGTLADGSDVNPEAICFEAQMPSGIARMIYWPNTDGSFTWAVESKTKKGWNRFTEHLYAPLKK